MWFMGSLSPHFFANGASGVAAINSDPMPKRLLGIPNAKPKSWVK
jgi:hypothetical protein